MFSLIVFVIVFAVGLYLSWRESYDLSDMLLGGFFSFLVAIMLSFVLTILGLAICVCGDTYADKASPKATYDVCALQDNFGTSYLGRCYYDNSLKYTFLYNDENGITAKTISSDGAYIHYSDEEPIVIAYDVYSSNSVLKTLFGSVDTQYDIYIPEGSIIEDYNIDLK